MHGSGLARPLRLPPEAQSPLLAEQYRGEGEMVAEGFKLRSMLYRIVARYRSIEDEDGWKLLVDDVDSVGKVGCCVRGKDPTELTNLADGPPGGGGAPGCEARDCVVEAYGSGALDAELSGSMMTPSWSASSCGYADS